MSTTTPAVKTTVAKAPVKPKSPKAPSHSLAESVADAKKLYDAFSHGTFSRTEYASALKISSTSGPTSQRLTSIREYGLLEGANDSYKVSESFLTLKGSEPGSVAFKKAAYSAVLKSDLFSDLIAGFSSKLPSESTIATRLEQQKKFNLSRAKELAKIFSDSLRYAQVVDSSGNIIAPRNGSDNEPAKVEKNEPADPPVDGSEGENSAIVEGNQRGDMLRLEISLKERGKVVVLYPPDLSPEDATRVGNVLAAIVG